MMKGRPSLAVARAKRGGLVTPFARALLLLDAAFL